MVRLGQCRDSGFDYCYYYYYSITPLAGVETTLLLNVAWFLVPWLLASVAALAVAVVVVVDVAGAVIN